MSVNSSCKGFFNKRLAPGCGMATVMLVIFLIAPAFAKKSDRDLQAKQVNLMIRQIGHRLLLQAGDSTSRVMPVTTSKAGTFLLEFENEFVFDHDSLIMLSQRLLPKTQFSSGYTVTVHECLKAAIVYGFQVNNASADILACQGRRQPSGCYTIGFTFPDFDEYGKQPNTERKKEEQQKADIHQPTEQIKSSKLDEQEATPTLDEFKTTISDHPFFKLVYSSMLVLLGVGVTLLIGRFGKKLTPVPAPNQNHATENESILNMPALGKFLFDAKGQRLLLGSEVISLTDKEYKILELLNNNFGELIPRETLMQKIWIDEGVITGRSLDMFVSKLRKKLSSDPDLRITNVHGRGYKLEMPVTLTL